MEEKVFKILQSMQKDLTKEQLYELQSVLQIVLDDCMVKQNQYEVSIIERR